MNCTGPIDQFSLVTDRASLLTAALETEAVMIFFGIAVLFGYSQQTAQQ